MRPVTAIADNEIAMLDSEFSSRDDFPPVDYEQWKALAEAALQDVPLDKKLVTHTNEGLDLQHVYSRKNQLGEGDVSGFPGSAPFVRGTSVQGAVLTGWDLRQEHASPQLDVANEAILADLEGGVSSLVLVFDRAARAGLDPDDERAADLAGCAGLMAYHVDDLDRTLAEVELSMIGVSLEAGAAFLPMAALMVALWRRRQVSTSEVRGAFNADPIAVLAREGYLPVTLKTALDQMSSLAAWTSEKTLQVTAVGVDTSPYHHAGANASQDIAFAMATAVQYLRSMSDAGMDIDAAAEQVLFRMSLDSQHFLSIAKLRAGRRLWARIVTASGGSAESAAMHVHARTSERVLTRRDPYINLLRNTVAVFAAGIGGAEAITSLPFDYTTGQTDSFSRRIARNTGLILQAESHLHRVIDPAGGSWFLENLTEQIAEKAWAIFQEIERQGGMSTALDSGWIAEQIDAAYTLRANDIATRKEGITGVSEFPDLDEKRIEHPQLDRQKLRKAASEKIKPLRKNDVSLSADPPGFAAAVDAAVDGATLGQLAKVFGFHRETATITPLETHRFAEPYEELRDAADTWQAAHGRRPMVFLANMGLVAEYSARAIYAKGFFETGGFEVIANEGFSDAEAAVKVFAESDASIAVICSSDELYSEFVPVVVPKLKAAGARTVVLAGKPGANEKAWRTAGVDRFIFNSCNVLATLRELLEEEGVLTG